MYIIRVSNYRTLNVERGTYRLSSNYILNRTNCFEKRFVSITADNGKEFSDHIAISKALDAEFYFAHAYASWERGLNENTNGLVRQYFPKKSSFAAITTEDIDLVMERLNSRPRKCLGYKTPNELFLGT